MSTLSLIRATTLSVVLAFGGIAYADSAEDAPPSSLVRRGFAISPVPIGMLNLTGETRAAIGLGSYLVNGPGDCSGCHSFPQFLPAGDTAGSNPPAGDPFLGAPSAQSVDHRLAANYNVAHYLAGGQCFGPFMARNLTPEPSGLPEGLTADEFIRVMRTGEDIHCEKERSDPICALGPATPTLQVMPWPAYHNMTDTDLRAIHAYLSSLPPATACNTVPNGCPGYSGAAAGSTNYAYASTADCPNPAPPQ